MAAAPWMVAGIAVWIGAAISYLGLTVYIAASYLLMNSAPSVKILGLWVCGTVMIRTAVSRACLRRVQQIAGEPQSRPATLTIVVLLAMMVYFAMQP